MDDLLIQGGIIAGQRQDVAIAEGRIRRIAPDLPARARSTIDATGRLVLPGFVESHIHPDKAYVADRTAGLRPGGPTPQVLVAELKRAFTVEDIHARARRVLLAAVRHGCTIMRAHVEIDSFVELRGVEAMRRLQAELADVLDVELIAFAQEGIFHDRVTQGLLRDALAMGLPVLGGCPYMDDDPRRHIDWFFDTAQAAGVPLDFHADSSDDPAQLTAEYIAEQTIARGMQGRVTLGHLCMLDILEPARRARVIDRLRDAGVHVISLPATELHVKGRAASRTWRGITRIEELRAAGVNVSISTNNIVNPFTPYGRPISSARRSSRPWPPISATSTSSPGFSTSLPSSRPGPWAGLTAGWPRAAGPTWWCSTPPTSATAITEQAEKLWVVK